MADARRVKLARQHVGVLHLRQRPGRGRHRPTGPRLAPAACAAASGPCTKGASACRASSAGRGTSQPGTTSDVPVIGSDIFTTICDVTGIPVPTERTIDGASWVPLFAGQAIERSQPLYWRNHLAPQEYKVGLRVGDWKIVGSDDLTKFELYNLREDWQETSDRSTRNPEKFEELKAQLLAHDAAVLADGPDWWKDETPATGGGPAARRVAE